MAFQSAPSCAEAVIDWSVSAVPAKNILSFAHAGGYSLADLTALANSVDVWWAAQIKPLTGVATTYDGTTVRGLEFENDQTVFDGSGVGIGSTASPPMPINEALCITHRSSLTGRSARGRTYFGGFTASQQLSTTSWIAALGPALADTFTTLRSAVALSGWRQVIISRFANGSKRLVAVTFDVVTTTSRNTLIDTQNGRLPKNH